LVARALNKNRELRLPSAAEFAAGLNSIAQKVRDSRTAPEPVTAVDTTPPVTAPPVAAKPAPPVVPAPKQPVVVPSAPAPAVVVQATQPATVAVPPPPPAPVPVSAPAQPALAAIKTAAQGSQKKVIPAAAAGLLRKRMIPIAIAGLLAIGVIEMLLSRSSSQASQPKSEAPTIQNSPAPVPVPIAVQPVEAAPPQPVPQPVAQTPAVSAVIEVKPAPETILRGQVKSLWEAGKYSQALGLVEAILADNPTHAEARVWKKKIRAAQDAEAAIK
jgi:hypothetical protein